MIPIDQTVMDEGRGDCARACLSSILEVPITAVPNFSDAPEGLFHPLYRGVLYGYGWILAENAHPKGVNLWCGTGINGLHVATVTSRNINGFHAVVIDEDGLVVHDPSPNKNFQGENIFDTGECHYFETYIERTDDTWQCFRECMIRAKMRDNG